jgi:hypothetical protein
LSVRRVGERIWVRGVGGVFGDGGDGDDDEGMPVAGLRMARVVEDIVNGAYTVFNLSRTFCVIHHVSGRDDGP